MAQTKLSCLWNTPRIAGQYQAAVSLHSHTNRSKESLGFIPEFAQRWPLLHWALEHQYKRSRVPVDLTKAYWTPPLTPKLAFEAEKKQIEIRDNPGINQNGIAKQCGMNRNRLARLLEEGRGRRWNTQPGPNKAKLYFPPEVVSVISIPPDTSDITRSGRSGVVSVVSHPKGDTTIPPTQRANTLHSCSVCGSFAMYREKDGSLNCLTCNGGA